MYGYGKSQYCENYILMAGFLVNYLDYNYTYDTILQFRKKTALSSFYYQQCFP